MSDPIRSPIRHGAHGTTCAEIDADTARQIVQLGVQVLHASNPMAECYCPVCRPMPVAKTPAPVAADKPAPTGMDKRRFETAPCYICGYNGPNYFQPATHQCAAEYQAVPPPKADPIADQPAGGDAAQFSLAQIIQKADGEYSSGELAGHLIDAIRRGEVPGVRAMPVTDQAMCDQIADLRLDLDHQRARADDQAHAHAKRACELHGQIADLRATLAEAEMNGKAWEDANLVLYEKNKSLAARVAELEREPGRFARAYPDDTATKHADRATYLDRRLTEALADLANQKLCYEAEIGAKVEAVDSFQEQAHQLMAERNRAREELAAEKGTSQHLSDIIASRDAAIKELEKEIVEATRQKDVCRIDAIKLRDMLEASKNGHWYGRMITAETQAIDLKQERDEAMADLAAMTERAEKAEARQECLRQIIERSLCVMDAYADKAVTEAADYLREEMKANVNGVLIFSANDVQMKLNDARAEADALRAERDAIKREYADMAKQRDAKEDACLREMNRASMAEKERDALKARKVVLSSVSWLRDTDVTYLHKTEVERAIRAAGVEVAP